MTDRPSCASLGLKFSACVRERSSRQVKGLTDILRPHLLRRTKGDVDLGITPMEETVISVDITNFQKRRAASESRARATICSDSSW